MSTNAGCSLLMLPTHEERAPRASAYPHTPLFNPNPSLRAHLFRVRCSPLHHKGVCCLAVVAQLLQPLDIHHAAALQLATQRLEEGGAATAGWAQ